MTATLTSFSGRNLSVVAIVLFLYAVANVLYTSLWIALKRNKQVNSRIIRRTTSGISPSLNATEFALTSTTPLPAHCPYLLNMTLRKRNYVLKPVDPPWASLLADYSGAIASGQNLYVWACNSQRKRKFGNQLFNFAAVFGVAWRNKRIPYWTVLGTHLSAFKHRLIIDKNYQRNVRHFNIIYRTLANIRVTSQRRRQENSYGGKL